ncbi:amidophosphoribosyltransferase [Bacillus sp. AFS015802]|uniref:ComF family protein n=1 Tax=Bacillus sp. AFS015802 TaxID=2033486 RepID=UPI000BF97C61|nr:ComF family protein [Bacillus sp. AFS015802]PFA67356.1 amidophosphoribosyltransferase [Bacillus sp. AFS015802]
MITNCLYCERELVEVMSWRGLFYREGQFLCQGCQEKLEEIEGKRCKGCSRSMDDLPAILVKGEICLDCHRWEQDPEWEGILHSNHSTYHYNDFLKEYLARFKYRGDYILAKAFSHSLKLYLSKTEYDHIIPIPLSDERLYERGFNQSIALLEEAEVRPSNILARSHSEKQSKKTRAERLRQEQVFRLAECDVKGKSILLFDDIYTTGTTLRQAAKLLKKVGADEVSSLTLARG